MIDVVVVNVCVCMYGLTRILEGEKKTKPLTSKDFTSG
jgi:hypothetical protein